MILHVGRGQLEYKAVLTVLNDRARLAAQLLVRVPIGDVLRCRNERTVILRSDTVTQQQRKIRPVRKRGTRPINVRGAA